MQVMRKIIIVAALIFVGNIFAAPRFEVFRQENNDEIFELKEQSKSIYFFCPLNSTNEQSYMEKFDLLFNKKKIQSIDSLTFNIVFFNSNVNRSKGLKVQLMGLNSPILINEFNCLFQNFSAKELLRHISRNEMLKYYISEFYSGTSTINVKLKEDIACYSSLAERIPNYENYIYQLIKPNYSEIELIESLTDSLEETNLKIIELQNIIQLQESELLSIKQKLVELEGILNKPSPIEDEKKKNFWQTKKDPRNE
jgi:hypothetical protein